MKRRPSMIYQPKAVKVYLSLLQGANPAKKENAMSHYHRIDYVYRPPTPEAEKFMSESLECRSSQAARRINALLLLSYAPTLDNPSLKRLAFTVGNLLKIES